MQFRKIGKLLSAVVLFIVLSGVSGWLTLKFITSRGDALVPNVTGKDVTSALKSLQKSHLYAVIAGERFDTTYPRGFVIEQHPEKGARRKQYSVVKLVLSMGPERIVMSDFRGMSIRQAHIEFEKLKPGVVKEIYVHSSTTSQGKVIATIPGPGEVVFPDVAITVLVSLGPKAHVFRMPDVVGKQLEKMREKLTPYFNIECIFSDVKGYKPGTIISQEPEPGAPVVERSDVTLTVSSFGTSSGGKALELFTYQLPAGLLKKRTRIVLESKNGERDIVFDEEVEPYQTIMLYLPKSGDKTLKVIQGEEEIFSRKW